MDSFGASSEKDRIMSEVKNEAAMTNARQLIERVNAHCFKKCITKPGTALSSGESSCLTMCMEKYMATWNTVSRSYVSRIQAESGKTAGDQSIASF